ncbi:hypothetical protein HDA32_004729 [Spinactinospora alkalitolerans]|uniref:Uncharacterized protein n=1 Tax=Spinactinospora alkalitolerans TaxID=687207 RepID=A0A852U032_9ACTN|nr:hypothetical protein [Spinactinospora alkalitolerans]NYE49609.1 hypothetical protein [Spinactinospora alkalitolerans]
MVKAVRRLTAAAIVHSTRVLCACGVHYCPSDPAEWAAHKNC